MSGSLSRDSNGIRNRFVGIGGAVRYGQKRDVDELIEVGIFEAAVSNRKGLRWEVSNVRYERLKTIMEHIFLTLTENETVARITSHNICGKMPQKNCKTLWDSVVTFLSLKVKPPAREPVVTPAYYGPFAEYEEPATGGSGCWVG